MDAELLQLLKAIKEKVNDIDRRLEKMEVKTDADHDKLIRIESDVENLIKDLEDHAVTERTFGRQFNDKLLAQDKKIDTQDEKIQTIDKTLVKYSVIISIIILGGNQGIEALKSIFGG